MKWGQYQLDEDFKRDWDMMEDHERQEAEEKRQEEIELYLEDKKHNPVTHA